MSELRDNPDNVEVAHEESDVHVGVILRYGVGLLVIGAVIHVLLWWLLGAYERQHQRAQTQVYPLAAGQQNRLPPAPRLQHNPQLDLQALRTEQEARLTGYGWVDKSAGVARIPIEDAMKMVVERGLPARTGAK